MMRWSDQHFWKQQLEQFLAAQESVLEPEEGDSSRPVDETPLCADEQELAQEIQGLLEEINRLAPLSQELNPEEVPKHVAMVDTEAEFSALGRFVIQRKLGSGGWGDVFQAFDPNLKRTVALKIPNSHALRSPEMRMRFLQEARISAGLSHPHIVPVYESGQQGHLCYMVGAYCPGGNLGDWLKEQPGPLPPRQAAQLLLILAQAVDHAHQRGILHRDLKPSNIMLEPLKEPSQDYPFGFIPHVGDFGLAKVLHDALWRDSEATMGSSQESLTQTHAMIGTPPYMAPEQTVPGDTRISKATDVYALGVILYELLTGRPPFRGATDWDTLTQVREQEPVPPRRLQMKIPADLETICLHCLHKNPDRRYASAADLAADLARFLEYKPILARPVGITEKVLKWAHRKPALAGLIGFAMLAMLVGGIGVFWHIDQLERYTQALEGANSEKEIESAKAVQQQKLASEKARQARQQAYVGAIGRAANLVEANHLGFVADLLNDYFPLGVEEDLRGFEWYYLWNQGSKQMSLGGHQHWIDRIAISPDGKTIASASGKATIILWDTKSGNLICQLPDAKGPVWDLHWSADGTKLGTSYPVEGYSPQKPFATYKIWDVSSRKVVKQLKVEAPWSSDIWMSRDFRHLYLLTKEEIPHEIVRWDVEKGAWKNILSWTKPYLHGALSQDGCLLALAGGGDHPSGIYPNHKNPGHLVIWDTAKEKFIFEKYFSIHSRISSPVFSPDGQVLAIHFFSIENSKNQDSQIYVLETKTGKLIHCISGLVYGKCKLQFSPKGRFLAGGGENGVVSLLDLNGNKEFRFPHAGPVKNFSFSSDENLLAINLGPDPHVKPAIPPRVQFLDLGKKKPLSEKIQAEVMDCQFLPGSHTLVMNWGDELLRPWKIGPKENPSILPGHAKEVWSVAFSPSGKLLASGSDDHTVKLWDLPTGKEITTLRGHESLVSAVAFSPQDNLLATASYDSKAILWDLETHKPVHILQGHARELRSLSFSHDGKLLATSSKDKTVKIWEVASGKLLETLPEQTNTVNAVAFSPRKKILALAIDDRTVMIWDLVQKKQKFVINANGPVRSVAFSPDGKLLAFGTNNGVIKLIAPESGEEKTVLWGHENTIRSLAFSPDGKTLASGSEDKTIKLWHVETGRELLTLPAQNAEVSSVEFSPDGQILATGSHDGKIKLWLGEKDK